ncbi:MAG: hypothetical protein DYG88_07595 [Chloroflexi bacterium CFX4]|nr:hypothetical protein [Chloroflexi bacterium CFX4]MDL1921189.1 hypothetical protein [Chloroflexi bacterium CFX3]
MTAPSNQQAAPRIWVDPNTEIMGGMIMGIVQSMEHEAVLPMLRKHNLENLNPNHWYPLQTILNFYHDVANAEGGMFNLVAIGLKVAELYPLPPHVTTFGQQLEMANELNRAAYRNGNCGEIITERLAETHYRVTMHLPFPPDLLYGIWWGLAKRLVPNPSSLRVKRDIRSEFTTVYEFQW